MAPPTSSGSCQPSVQDLQQIMDQRKRKRMISNRESARRSRMKKQKRLDDLVAQGNQLRNENSYILANLTIITQLYVSVEAENSVLGAQMSELSHRLQSLSEIINCLETQTATAFEAADLDNKQDAMYNYSQGDEEEDGFLNPWNLLHVNQPVMASADGFVY